MLNASRSVEDPYCVRQSRLDGSIERPNGTPEIAERGQDAADGSTSRPTRWRRHVRCICVVARNRQFHIALKSQSLKTATCLLPFAEGQSRQFFFVWDGAVGIHFS